MYLHKWIIESLSQTQEPNHLYSIWESIIHFCETDSQKSNSKEWFNPIEVHEAETTQYYKININQD